MAVSSADTNNDTDNLEPPQKLPGKKKGGIKTMPFIIANEAFEKVASFGLGPNMILYLIRDYKMGIASGTNLLFYWNAANNFMPVIGAFLSDSYLGRFLTIGFGCAFSLLGMILFWLTTVIRKLKPPSCVHECKSATSGQYAYLFSAFMCMSIGAGGIRPCSLVFGADQLDNRGENRENKRVLETFFSWYYASTAVSVLAAFTVIVYIQEHLGWRVGFGIPAILMFLSAVMFFIASPMYIKVPVERSIITSFAQVLVASYRNRKLDFPPPNSDSSYFYRADSVETKPTENLRFLNKACIIRNPKDITLDGVASNPWRLCTVEQVEELKMLFRVIPLWSSSIMISITLSQGSFPVLQANSMDRHLTRNFEIPAGSFIFFTIIAAMIWVCLYDRVLIPFASRIRGKPTHLGVRLRMGIGLFLSVIGMSVSAIVEHYRHKKASREGFLTNPHRIVSMSALWLIPQHCLTGLSEALNAIGQSEFYYSEFPKSMCTISTALLGLQGAAANLLSSVILNSVDKFTGGEGKESWISTNINQGRYENYYWLLAIMSFINLFYYVYCARAYGPCVDEVDKPQAEQELQLGTTTATGGGNAEELSKSLF